MYLLKMSGPQIRVCLFTFRLIASKQFNSLTTIDTLSWLGGAVLTHPLWVKDVLTLIVLFSMSQGVNHGEIAIFHLL